MNHKLKILVISIITFILSYIIAPRSGRLYEKIIGRNVTSWLGGCAECYEGFFIAFTFLSALLFFSLLDKKRINTTLIFILIPSLLLLFARQGDAFLIALGFGLVGLGLGQLIYLLRKKFIPAKVSSDKKEKPAVDKEQL